MSDTRNIHALTLPIEGMTCAACAARIEKVLNRLPDVEAQVNFATEKAQVKLTGNTSVQQVIDKIKHIGYDIPDQKIELEIGGMSCVACANRIEKVLNKQPNVHANVNFSAERATIHYAAGSMSSDDLINKISALGFSAHVLQDQQRTQAKQRKQQEFQHLRHLFLVAVLFTAPLMVEMVAMLFGQHGVIPVWVQCLLATPVQFWCGREFYKHAYNALRGGSANMDVLVVLGTSAAYFYSSVAILVAGMHSHVYFEASATIITLVLLGKLLEARAKAKTGAAIESLLNLQPQIAHVEREGQVSDLAVSQMKMNDIFIIRPGESIPVDGVVIDGMSEVNESMLTGESVPVHKTIHDQVFAATLNHHGALRVKATGLGSDTALAKIIHLVEQAQGSKASIQRLADKISGVFVPIVVAISLVTLILTWILTLSFSTALVSAVAVLVIACPCALGLATPTAIMVGTGQGAKAGILFRNAEALERAQQINTLVVDKTGTLTEGRPAVQHLVNVNAASDLQLLALALGLEQDSEHPLAKAVVDYAQQKGIQAKKVDQFQAAVGRGVSAKVDGQIALLGSPRYLNEQNIEIDQTLVEDLEQQGNTVIAVALAGVLQGYIGFMDQLRPDAVSTVAALQQRGIKVVMLTGDSPRVAKVIAEQVKVDEFIAGVLPEDKAAEIQRLKSQLLESKQGLVGMVGDGINDAPALAVADVGFAIGAGSDVALESADVVLMRSQLGGLLDAIDLSQATLRKVKQNLFFAFIYNALGIPLAAFGLLNPVIAGAAMALSSVSVLSNSLLLRSWQAKSLQSKTVKNVKVV